MVQTSDRFMPFGLDVKQIKQQGEEEKVKLQVLKTISRNEMRQRTKQLSDQTFRLPFSFVLLKEECF